VHVTYFMLLKILLINVKNRLFIRKIEFKCFKFLMKFTIMFKN